MSPRPGVRRFLLGFSLALWAAGRACASTAGIPPTASLPAPATSTPSPPTARILYAADDLPTEVQSAARGWAESRGLSFTVGPVGNVTPSRIADGLAFVVSFHGAEWATDPAFAEAGVRGVAVDPLAPASSRLVSRISATRETWEEAGFLGGVLVGLIGDGQAGGWVRGDEDTEQANALAAGFDQGLRYACPRCLEVRQDADSIAVAEFVQEGADGVFVAPGDEAVGASVVATDAGLWIVWVGEAPAEVSADHLAATLRLDPTALVSAALDALAAGEEAQTWPYSARSGSLTIDEIRSEAISPGRQRLAQQAWDKLASGELQLVEP